MKVNEMMVPSIDQLADQYLNGKGVQGTKAGKSTEFSDILSVKQLETIETPRFSKHAVNRLSDRQLTLTDEQLDRLTEGAIKAGAKGINESLVLVDDLAFIVNIKNNTVVTALDSTRSDESVYTNIDGAVIA
ncbi:MAG: flagellar protein [Lachnospiraceae bacterium]|nr:flagellar protein [Lachnospiraceae bacterium]